VSREVLALVAMSLQLAREALLEEAAGRTSEVLQEKRARGDNSALVVRQVQVPETVPP
jgi:hypothetical protein